MSRKCFDPKECISPLNTVKQSLQLRNCPFSREAILSAMKQCGLPTNNKFWKVFRESGIIQEVSKGQFAFTSKEPIFWAKLQEVKVKYQKLLRQYADKTKERAKTPKEETQKSSKDMEQLAIELLKKKGYRIFKPIGILCEEL